MGTKGVTTGYLSTGANRQTAVADWSKGGLVAFGADINVALWRPKATPSRGIVKLLQGHKGLVRAVSFLPAQDDDESTYLITGSEDKSLIIHKAPSGSDDFSIVQSSAEHAGPVNCIASWRSPTDPSPRWVIATGAADATIKIWNFQNDQLQLLQSIATTPKIFPLTLALSSLGDEGQSLMLAAAGTRDTVQILTSDTQDNSLQFNVQATLTGHENWIRSLSFVRESTSPGSDLLLASASQDKYIRIWRVHEGKELPALAAAAEADPTNGAYLPGKSPSNKAHRLKTAGRDFSVTFEALLLGHEDWIYSAKWHSHADGKPQLLSTSADNSLAIWEADPSSGIWVSMVRLGEISREKGATTATGSTGGFWTGLWSPDGKSVACLGRTGSWRIWEHDEAEDLWRPCVSVSGHTKAVTGISWSKGGDYLLSISADQTTRLHTQHKAGGNTWHEMSRPQIHGYDLNCIDTLGDTQFVSGADEKLMRVFSEPKAVASLLHRLGGIGGGDINDRPDAANMPVLGLSNKAIDTVDDDQEIAPVDDRDRDAMDPASVVKKSHLELDHPPFEETLSRHTLWPETEKLYGHGYELSCLATSHDGKIIASACKASSKDHAVIRLFETEKWTEVRPPLSMHTLTATRLRFSPDDKYLLSVGRDRLWAVFERDSANPSTYAQLQSCPKAHTRMILDAAWAPSTDRPLFATAGRDKLVRIWAAGSGDGATQFAQATVVESETPVTAVDFLPTVVGGSYVLAVGTEAGRLGIYTVSDDGTRVAELSRQAENDLPKTVLQLAWRPARATAEERKFELAVAGDDSSLRVYSYDEDFLKA